MKKIPIYSPKGEIIDYTTEDAVRAFMDESMEWAVSLFAQEGVEPEEGEAIYFFDRGTGTRYCCENRGQKKEKIMELPDRPAELPSVREETALIQETGKNIQELLAGMRAMGEMMRVMNERMTAMEQTIRTLEKVTPGQAAEINKRIRGRAAEICREYSMAQGKTVAGAIRKDVREMTGVKTAREIARCDYPAVKEFVESWEDYDVIMKIRAKEREA